MREFYIKFPADYRNHILVTKEEWDAEYKDLAGEGAKDWILVREVPEEKKEQTF